MKLNLKIYLIISIFVFNIQLIYSQQSQSTGGESDTTLDILSASKDKRIKIAMSSPYYPVTPGDIYILEYMAGSIPVKYAITIDASYKLKIANLGIVDASKKSYLQLKEQIETLVSKYYPMSGAQFTLADIGIFTVYITGEVLQSREVEAWGLSRLSDFWKSYKTPYSSMRKVKVRSIDGIEKYYDLFRAKRYGDMSQDPYLMPGDTIIFEKYDRKVTIQGEIRRDGEYQLLSGEGLKDLIETYGDGFTPLADREKIQITRYVNSLDPVGEKIFISRKDVEQNFPLQNLDQVYVHNISEIKPVIFLEGAIKSSDSDPTTPEKSNVVVVPFLVGENYASLIRRYRGWLSSISDTANAYILRKNNKLPFNLNPILYESSYISEYMVEPYDRVFIPFRQAFVTVAGAVKNPGRYPYIPDRDWNYYIALAGGFDPERNKDEAVIIYDINRNRLKKSDPITPECIIEAETNSFLYYYSKYAPPIVTTLSIINTILSVLILSGVVH